MNKKLKKLNALTDDDLNFILNRTNKAYHLNSYYDLTNENIIYLIRQQTLKNIKADLLAEYQSYYALSWYENFIYIINKIDLRHYKHLFN